MILLLLIAPVLSSVLTLCYGYKSYKKIYKTLNERKFYINNSQVYSHEWDKEDDGFVWFLDDNHFKLEKSVYLHDSCITYLDPYSFYWLLKYRKWFKENIDIYKIEKY